MTEDRRWAIRKTVNTYEDGMLRSHVETALDEDMFISREACEKRVEKLNEGNPDKPYRCEPADGLTVPVTVDRRPRP